MELLYRVVRGVVRTTRFTVDGRRQVGDLYYADDIFGLETLRQLRLRVGEVPALLVTSHPQPSLRAAAAAAGVQILETPLLGDTLVAEVHRLLPASA